ncbi:carboxypeptidase regulatory-like domain-containing protein [Archangium violaceum]|uniref:carboxypeptidase regulatory-like domain-containing protein n=1 Tax=Archangium violaceum TaxID=83451 RepID=UPI00193B1B41|nr:carboxypeptidase regulatory-like domain-containing protein [Archangium violaceum]
MERCLELDSCESRTLDITLPHGVLVRGRVVDEAGHPVDGVRVALSRPPPGGGEDAPVFVSTVSDAEGTFSLDAPEPGDYTAHLSHPDFLVTEGPVSAPVEGARLVLRSGTHVEVEVVDESGRPVAEAEVSVRVAGAEDSHEEKTGTTDERGKVTLKGFEPGKYVVTAQLPLEGHLRRVRRSVESRGAELLRVRLSFEAGLELSGVVVDGEGLPVEGARVELAPVPLRDSREGHDTREESVPESLADAWDSESVRPLLTDARGRFTMKHLRPGYYQVTVLKEGYVLRAPTAQGEMDSTPSVIVSAGAREVRLVLDFLGMVKGRVVRADGSPVTRFRLNDLPVEDEQGVFRWPIEEDGELVLTFAAQDLAGTERKERVRRGEAVDLGDIVLRLGREVRVRVVDAESARPVRGALLDLRTPEQGGAASTRSLLFRETAISRYSGRFRMSTRLILTNEEGVGVLPHVESQPLLLIARHDDFLETRVPLGAEQREVVVPLNAGARVVGTVRAGTVAVDSGTVLLCSPDGGPSVLAVIHEGAYSSGPLRAGRYTLQVAVGNVSSDEPPPVFLPRSVEVPASGKVTLDFEAAPRGTAVEPQATCR